jgi:hypothetical protein
LRVSLVPPDFEITTVRVWLRWSPIRAEDAIESVRVGVIEEMNVERIAGLAERVGDELRPQGRTADADDRTCLNLPVFRRDFAGVDIGGELFDARVGLVDVSPELRRRREFRIAEPIMADHSALIGIGDRARFQFAHRGERFFHRVRIVSKNPSEKRIRLTSMEKSRSS